MNAKKQKIYDESVKQGMRTLVGTTQGQDLLHWIMANTNMFQTCFAESERTTSFLLGQQSFGLQLLAKIEQVEPRVWELVRNRSREYDSD